MRKIYLFILTCISLSLNAQVLNTELIQHYSLDDIEAVKSSLGIPDNFLVSIYEVDFYRIEYMTPHPNGSDVMASGVICVPEADICPLPLSSYQHGTIAKKTDAPSFQSTEGLLCALYASAGYLGVAADYIGLGTGPGMHLYVHAESEANACIDLLRAAVTLQDELTYSLSGELFLWGYSQGGHATAALQRKIETEASDQFTITASAPMSGPYNISGVQADVITSDVAYPTPGYLPYVAISYQEAYGTLYENIEDFFQPEYAAILPGLFDGTHSMGEINAACPSIPNQILADGVLEAYENNPDHPIRQALEDNDLLDWAPAVPTRIIYCDADDQVNYQNSIIALDAYQNLGSTTVEAVNMGSYNHGFCAPFAMFEGYSYFESMRSPSFEAEVSAEITADVEGLEAIGAISVEVNAAGNWTFQWSHGADELNLVNLEAGEYMLTVISEDGCRLNYTFEVELATSIVEMSDDLQFYPVPVEDQLRFNTTKNIYAELYDLRGSLIESLFIQPGSSFDFSRYSPGVYILKSESGKSYSILKK